MREPNSRYGATTLILFLCFPFAGFIRACKRLNLKICGLIFILFYGLYGYAHKFEDVRSDSFRKCVDFTRFHANSWADVLHSYTKGDIPDLFEYTVYYAVKLFTHNPHIMTMLVGLWGATFAWLAIRKVVSHYHGKPTWTYFLLLFYLVQAFPPNAIGGVRQFAALGLCIYSTVCFLIDKKTLWIIPITLCSFIHFAFIAFIPVILFIKYVKVPWRVLFYSAVILCAAGSVISSAGYNKYLTDNSITQSNKAIKDKAGYYSSDSADDNFNESLTTKLSKISQIVNIPFNIYILYFLRRRYRRGRMTPLEAKYFYYALYFLAFGYLMSGLSVVGGRYLVIGNFMRMSLLLLCYNKSPRDKKLARIIWAMPIFGCISIALMAFKCLLHHQSRFALFALAGDILSV